MSWRCLALGLGLAGLVTTACQPAVEVPTIAVQQQSFVHRVTAEGVLQAAKATSLVVPQEVQGFVRLAWIAPEGSLVEEGQVVARFDPAPLTEQLERSQSTLEGADIKVGKSRLESDAKLGEHLADGRIADLELDFSGRMPRVDSEVFSRHQLIEMEIDHQLAGHKKTHAMQAEQVQRSLAATEVALLAIEQRQARYEIGQAEQGLRGLEARAPHRGILVYKRDWRGEPPQIGNEMWRGQPIAEIPDLSAVEAEVFVLEADAGGLTVGKPAAVVVEAHPETVYRAHIRRVDAIAKPRFRGSPVQYFGVILAFAGPSAELKPGTRVRATLELEDIQDALVVPRQAIFQENGESRVYVHAGSGATPFSVRTVEIQATSLALVAIAHGVKPGERVALERPADATIAAAPAAAAAVVSTAARPQPGEQSRP